MCDSYELEGIAADYRQWYKAEEDSGKLLLHTTLIEFISIIFTTYLYDLAVIVDKSNDGMLYDSWDDPPNCEYSDLRTPVILMVVQVGHWHDTLIVVEGLKTDYGRTKSITRTESEWKNERTQKAR